MSQSHHPTDSQALLQSMLQRLKLQPGKDGQTQLQTPAAAFTVEQDGRGGPNHQEDDNMPVNVFGFKKVPAGSFTQQPAPGCEVGKGWTSSPTQNVNSDGDTGGSSVLGTWKPFPTGTSKDFKRNHVPPNTDAVPSVSQVQSFTPRWSHPDTACEESKVFHEGNGGISGLKDSPDVQIFSGNQVTTANIRKKRPSENKTRRWTQRIKERWTEKHSKKGQEDEEAADQRTQQGTQISTTNLVVIAGKFTNTPNNHEETNLLVLGSCFPSETLPAQTEEDTTDSRHNSDFDFGLGSFSLLEEITKGQEWAKFINPNLSTPSINQRPPEETQPKVPPNPFSANQSAGSVNQLRDGSSPWTFRSTEPPPAQTALVFSSVSMEVSDGKQQESSYRPADPVELMEHGHNQSDGQLRESRPGPQLGPSATAQASDILHSAVLKVRGQTSRKRQHQSAEGARSTSAPVLPSSQLMEDSSEPPLDAPPPPPSSLNPALVPRGILKHSTSHVSGASMTKRRRVSVEENRLVHFSEEVITIEPPSMDWDLTDSEEEDWRADEESLSDQEFEEEQVAAEEVIQARRSTLPAWIKALKRKNTGKKNSQGPEGNVQPLGRK